MSQTVSNDRRIVAVSLAAAAATVAAGILHIMMVHAPLTGEGGEGVLFLIGGILQVFWAVPVLKRWGRIWQIIGIAGTVVFMALWFATHTHSLLGPGGAEISHGLHQGNFSREGGPAGLQNVGAFPREGHPRGLAGIPAIEYLQMAFVGLYAALGIMISRKGEKDKKAIAGK